MTKRRAAPLVLPLLAATFVGVFGPRGESAALAQDDAPATPPASAARPAPSLFSISEGPFGEASQMAFSMSSEGEFPFSFSKTDGSAWSLRLRPSLDYFIQRNVSVGGIVAIEKDGGTSTIRLGARAGYNAVLGSLVSIWIRGGLDIGRTSPNNGPSTTVTDLSIGVPFLFHFATHFLLGVGPFFSLPLSNSAAMGSKDPTYGLTALVGGYF